MRFGSVCSGIEAASVAWHGLGWQAAWVSEIEAFPSAVLAHHWPAVPNLGDMLAIPAAVEMELVEAPDLLVGGTPCQAFSVAGKRGSLDDARGALTLAYVKLADEIDAQRRADGRPECIIVWENVPGVLSTKDNAFGCFLAGLAGEDEALEPPGGRWSNAGAVFGPERAVAWRLLDAQYFGVAQRRRRVFVVASARDGFDPCEVLFERDGLRRDTAPSREKGQGFAADAGPGAAGGCFWDGGQLTQTLDAVLHKGQTMPEKNRFPAVLQPTNDNAQAIPILEPGARTGVSTTDPRAGLGIGADGDPMFTLQAGKQHGLAHTVALHGRDGGATAELGGEVATALRASTGGGDKPHVLAFHANAQADQLPSAERDTSISDSLTCSQSAAVACALAFAQNTRDEVRLVGGDGEISGALAAQPGMKQTTYVAPSMAVRRLTPTECERLQGFPDGHTLVPYRNKPAADGPRYKALGNSMAVPVMAWIGQRIDAHLRGELSVLTDDKDVFQ